MTDSGGANRYRNYVLAVLTLVYTINFLDRGLIGLLLQPIKEEMHLSDGQLGILTGIAFGLFYATVGVPIARWSDRGDRVAIASMAIALWGLTVWACFFVTNFVQLLLARMAAAIGEAGCLPPAYSLIGDYFPAPAERTRAMSKYMLAGPIAAVIGLVGGGWLNQHFGWRTCFLVMSLPAFPVAVLLYSTAKEPRRHAAMSAEIVPAMPYGAVARLLWQRRALRHLAIGLILIFTMGYGLGPWYAAFMMRSHGMGSAELGVWLGFIFGISGSIGTYLGGDLTARLFPGNEGAQLRLCAAMFAAVVPFFFLFLLPQNRYVALAALLPLGVAINFFIGPSYALLQRLVPAQARATTLAFVLLLVNLIGLGIGPLLVGVLSDALQPTFGIESLRYAMLCVSLIGLFAALHLYLAGRTILSDLTQAGDA